MLPLKVSQKTHFPQFFRMVQMNLNGEEKRTIHSIRGRILQFKHFDWLNDRIRRMDISCMRRRLWLPQLERKYEIWLLSYSQSN